jgi:cyd operon protein YbgT
VSYFTWILGVGFSVLLAILNAMWLVEAQEDLKVIASAQQKDGQPRERQRA